MDIAYNLQTLYAVHLHGASYINCIKMWIYQARFTYTPTKMETGQKPWGFEALAFDWVDKRNKKMAHRVCDVPLRLETSPKQGH